MSLVSQPTKPTPHTNAGGQSRIVAAESQLVPPMAGDSAEHVRELLGRGNSRKWGDNE